MKVDDEVAPLHQGTTATIRATSLSGIANRYVSLNPGPTTRPRSRTAARSRADDTAAPVDLDQLFNTPRSQDARGPAASSSRARPTATTARRQAGRASARVPRPGPAPAPPRPHQRAGADEQVFERFLIDGAQRRGRDRRAPRRPRRSSSATRTPRRARSATRTWRSSQALGLLPPTLRKANTTFVNLRAALDDLDKLVAESQARHARSWHPSSPGCARWSSDARPTVRDLRALIRTPGQEQRPDRT